MSRKYSHREEGTHSNPKYKTRKVCCDKISASGVHYHQPTRFAVSESPQCFEEDTEARDPRSVTCTRFAYQRANVSVPVVVKPFSFAGPTTTMCCDEPKLKDIRCEWGDNRICYFTFTQEICVEVPIHFGANATAGKPSIECLPVSLEKCDS